YVDEAAQEFAEGNSPLAVARTALRLLCRRRGRGIARLVTSAAFVRSIGHLPRGSRIAEITAVKALDSFFKAVSANEPHSVKWAAVGVMPQPVDGHNARMFKRTSDFSFLKEARSALLVTSVLLLDFLKGDFAMQFLVLRDRYFAQTAFAPRPKDSES